jgi:hypothetical protein
MDKLTRVSASSLVGATAWFVVVDAPLTYHCERLQTGGTFRWLAVAMATMAAALST